MSKPNVTRTLGPIHFEDLDPHRFEDLIRELIYDFKDWQTIEATGRSGNDEGFDIRAYEKVAANPQISDEDDDYEEIHPMEGNLWMIQGKREKEIGPKRIKEIVSDVNSKNPPYGYILAASSNFSKDSFDTFREELRKKGVMEFYLWGSGELEDMLHLPKNDRVLFTFFGISLFSKRRSRTAELRQVVVNKNKLFKITGERHSIHQTVLLRDSKDTHYPYKDVYKDFEIHPRWQEYKAVEHHPTGLIVNLLEHVAYIDQENKEYDFTEVVNLIFRESDSQKEKDQQRTRIEKVEDFRQYLPRRNQATFFRNGLIRFDEMLLIDDKGDVLNNFPHIYVDYDFETGPIADKHEYLEVGKRPYPKHISLVGYKRVSKFPKSFPEPTIGKIYEEKKGLTLNQSDYDLLKHGDEMFNTLFSNDDRYSFLKQKDIVRIENADQGSTSKFYLQITNIENLKLVDYLEKYPESKWMIEKQIGKNANLQKVLNVYEFKRAYDFVVESEKMNVKKSKN